MTIIVGETERAALKAAMARARTHPMPWEVVKREITDHQETDTEPVEDRPPAPERPPSEYVDLPFGYVVAISFEEQPAGMCLHVSVSGPWQVSSDAENGEVAPSRAADISPTLTPDEVMRDAHRELNEALADELIQRIRSGTPAFFERLGGAPFGGDGLWRFGW